MINLDLSDVEGGFSGFTTEFSLIEDGEYIAQIEKWEESPYQNGEGKALILTWVIVDGEYRNRKVWDRIPMTDTPGKQYKPGGSAVEMYKRKVRTIIECGNHPNPNFIGSFDELLDLAPMSIHVIIKPGKNGWKDKNEVNGYRYANGQAPPKKSSSQKPQTAPPAPKKPIQPPADSVYPPSTGPAWMRGNAQRKQADQAPF